MATCNDSIGRNNIKKALKVTINPEDKSTIDEIKTSEKNDAFIIAALRFYFNRNIHGDHLFYILKKKKKRNVTSRDTTTNNNNNNKTQQLLGVKDLNINSYQCRNETNKEGQHVGFPWMIIITISFTWIRNCILMVIHRLAFLWDGLYELRQIIFIGLMMSLVQSS